MAALELAIGSGGSIYFRAVSCRKSKPLSFNSFHSNPLSALLRRPFSRHPNLRSFPSRPSIRLAHGDHDQDHHTHQGNHSHHNHNHGHHHHHDNHDCHSTKLTGPQQAVLNFARVTKWAELADFLREHLVLCCCSTALLLVAAACPYLLPKAAVKPLQNAFIAIAFPLVGVWIFCLSLMLV